MLFNDLSYLKRQTEQLKLEVEMVVLRWIECSKHKELFLGLTLSGQLLSLAQRLTRYRYKIFLERLKQLN